MDDRRRFKMRVAKRRSHEGRRQIGFTLRREQHGCFFAAARHDAFRCGCRSLIAWLRGDLRHKRRFAGRFTMARRCFYGGFGRFVGVLFGSVAVRLAGAIRTVQQTLLGGRSAGGEGDDERTNRQKAQDESRRQEKTAEFCSAKHCGKSSAYHRYLRTRWLESHSAVKKVRREISRRWQKRLIPGGFENNAAPLTGAKRGEILSPPLAESENS